MTIAAMPSSSLFFFVIIIIMIISYNYATRKKITWCGTKWTNEKKLVANERTWCCCWMMMINIHWWCVCGCNLCKISHEDAIIVPMVFLPMHWSFILVGWLKFVVVFFFICPPSYIYFLFFFNIQTSIGSGIFSLLLWFFFIQKFQFI